MSRLIRVRHAARLVAAGIGPGACLGAAYNFRPTVIRFDSVAGPATEQWRPIQTKISPKVARQISSGSMTGFAMGVLVALFSRTLALLGSFLAVTFYAASRYGIDLPKLLGVKKLLRQSPVWNKLEGKPWFTASFVITFTLAAFAKI